MSSAVGKQGSRPSAHIAEAGATMRRGTIRNFVCGAGGSRTFSKRTRRSRRLPAVGAGSPSPGLSGISCAGRAVHSQALIAFEKRSPHPFAVQLRPAPPAFALANARRPRFARPPKAFARANAGPASWRGKAPHRRVQSEMCPHGRGSCRKPSPPCLKSPGRSPIVHPSDAAVIPPLIGIPSQLLLTPSDFRSYPFSRPAASREPEWIGASPHCGGLRRKSEV